VKYNVDSNSAITQDIELGRYHIVVINPETLMMSDELRVLWTKASFTKRILAFVFDEGHCITQWGKFRKHYLAVGIIRLLISDPVPFYVASATLPPPLLAETRKLLHMNPADTIKVLCSNNRPDIALMVRELVHPALSYQDLHFLIPYNWQEGMDVPKKFLVFFNDIQDAQGVKKSFHDHLLKVHHNKIVWFHSTMSQEYCEDMVEKF
jgi:superfamily II DNA helicase RecQ